MPRGLIDGENIALQSFPKFVPKEQNYFPEFTSTSYIILGKKIGKTH